MLSWEDACVQPGYFDHEYSEIYLKFVIQKVYLVAQLARTSRLKAAMLSYSPAFDISSDRTNIPDPPPQPSLGETGFKSWFKLNKFNHMTSSTEICNDQNIC